MPQLGSDAVRQEERCRAWMFTHLWSWARRQRALGTLPVTTQHRQIALLESRTAGSKCRSDSKDIIWHRAVAIPGDCDSVLAPVEQAREIGETRR